MCQPTRTAQLHRDAVLGSSAMYPCKVHVIGGDVRIEVDKRELHVVVGRWSTNKRYPPIALCTHLHPVGKVHLEGVHAPRAAEVEDVAACRDGWGWCALSAPTSHGPSAVRACEKRSSAPVRRARSSRACTPPTAPSRTASWHSQGRPPRCSSRASAAGPWRRGRWGSSRGTQSSSRPSTTAARRRTRRSTTMA